MRITYDFRTYFAHEIYVDEKPRMHALKKLRGRIDAGESPYDVLGISPQEDYYVQKLIKGLCPISYALYGRIMRIDEEDNFLTC